MEQNKALGNPDKVWLMEQFQRRGLTQGAVARQMQISPANLSYTLSGQRRLNLNELKQLADILKVDAVEIMARWGFAPQRTVESFPVRYHLRDDCVLTPCNAPYATVPAAPGLPVDAFAVQVRSTALPGSIWDGMYLYLPQGNFMVNEVLGRLALVNTFDSRCLLGVVSRGYDLDRYNVTHPANHAQVEGVSIESVLPVSWMRPHE